MSKDEEFNDWLCEREDGIGYSSFDKRETADEMFEKLGYKKKNLDIIFSRFWEEWKNEDLAKTFSFNTEYETIDITDENEYGITMQELQAINKKCQEWSWYNERK